MKRMVLNLVLFAATLAAIPLPAAVSYGPFGPNGEGGARNGQEFRIGPGGSVYELDAFVSLSGQDLNGGLAGVSAQLSRQSLPPGLVCRFSSVLSTDKTDVVLTYVLSNRTNTPFNDVRFLVMLDPEIDQETNTFFNEYGTVLGAPGQGPGDAAPDMWQIDEPGFATGSLYRNLALGLLSNSNAIPASASNDVAMALGFSLGSIKPGESNTVKMLISEVGHTLGTFALVQHDLAPGSTTVITFSGQADAQAQTVGSTDATGILQLSFVWRLNRPTGSLLGKLTVKNASVNSLSFGAPFYLGFPSSTNYSYVHPVGALSSGLPYVDLTSAVAGTAAAANGTLDPGETMVIDKVEIVSRNRHAPPTSLFQLWATQSAAPPVAKPPAGKKPPAAKPPAAKPPAAKPPPAKKPPVGRNRQPEI